MKATTAIALLMLACASLAHAQPWADTTQARLTYGLDVAAGGSYIEGLDGQRIRYQLVALMPVVRYGDWSGGLQINLRFRRFTLRDQDFDQARDYLSWLRFAQYRQKDDEGWHARVGALDEVELGYGQQVDAYTNTASLDDPQTGTVIDYRRRWLSVETLNAQILAPSVMAVRFAYQPLDRAYATPRIAFDKLVIGFNAATDQRDESGFINAANPGQPFFIDRPPTDTGDLPPILGTDDGALWVVGMDVGVPFKLDRIIQSIGFASLNMMPGYGAGGSVGLRGTRPTKRFGRLRMQAEVLLLGSEYLPSYFGALYEADRLRILELDLDSGETLEAVTSKRNLLTAEGAFRLGSRTSVNYRYKEKVRFDLSYERLWNRRNSGWLHADLRLQSPEWPFVLRLAYDKRNVGYLSSEIGGGTSLLRAEGAYQFWEYLMLGLTVKQSFEPAVRNAVFVGQAKRLRVEPKIVFVLRP
ncbi:MAG: hypothetical protein AAF730_18965 [Bacteroidota bacterium]